MVATHLHLHRDAVRPVLGEIGLSVRAPFHLALDGVLGNDVLHVGGVGLLGLNGQGRLRDEVFLRVC